MPLLEIATAQPNFRNHLGALGAQAFVHGRLFSSSFAFGNDKRLASWKLSNAPKRILVEPHPPKFVVKAVATLECMCSVLNEDVRLSRESSQVATGSSSSGARLEPSEDDGMELDEREKLRRMRISKANKGNTPWNKGRKHSAETLQRIRERTRLAMQNPKVMSCQDEVDQPRTCTEEYRERVCSGLAKYHGTPVGVERKPRRKPADAGGTRPRKRSPSQKKSSDMDSTPRLDHQSQIQKLRLKRRKTPLFKDPLASSKLELIKSIRAHRAAQETNKTEAIARARLLIAEAERAAKALEAAAVKSPIARASLAETRKLIAEAIQSIESIDIGSMPSTYNGSYPSAALPDLINHIEEETATVSGNRRNRRKVNGSQVKTWEDSDGNFDFGGFSLPDVLDEEGELDPIDLGFVPLDLEARMDHSGERHDIPEPNGLVGGESRSLPNGTKTNVQSTGSETCSKPIAATKKWVRGRLVDAAD
ncbi:uncharacterized protein LOC115683707 isoform X3 [Syzygium oleosum]|uniref:uncharacterized protein LOC115683707 isoform X3 n=1 Tax=Syzygium oleosum TaxID=219896 RepID=UPI0024B955EE|nr:uncharacterized protein LOC115683707 isoform X3 [Syzygium oleosum]